MPILLAVCLVLASLAAGVLALAAWLWATRLQTSIPGPPTLPLLGNATMFYKLPVLLDRLGELHRRYGDIFRLYVGPKLVVVVTQPDDVQRLMATSKPGERDPYLVYLMGTFLGNGLIVSNGDEWKRQRKFIAPAFHKEELEKFVDVFNESGSFLCDKLAGLNGAETEVSVLLTMATTRSVSASIFYTKLDLLQPDPQKQRETAALIVDFAKAFSTMIYRPWATISFFKWITAEGRTLLKLKRTAKDVVDGSIALMRENDFNIDISGRSLISNIHPEKKNQGFMVTENEIHEIAITLLAAGIETTSDTIGYVLTLLGLHPEWQDRVQRELDDVFGNGGDCLRPTTTEDLAQLTVLDAIVKETLRLFPTVPCVPNVLTEDTPLGGGRYLAPRGTSVLVAYYLMHRNPQLFPDPHKFDPGRFLEGGSATSRIPYSYAPFSVGPRKCIGDRFAILKIKIVLSMVLRRFRILPGSSRKELEETVLSIALHPITGFRITCLPRDNTPLISP